MVETSSHFPTHRGDNWWAGLVDPLKQFSARVADYFAPDSEAAGAEKYYEIHVELPGVEQEDIEISVHDDTLMVRGEKKFERTEEGKTYFFSERTYGRFQRSFRLPADADDEKISASHRNGVLTIKIAKADKKAPGGRKISISQG